MQIHRPVSSHSKHVLPADAVVLDVDASSLPELLTIMAKRLVKVTGVAWDDLPPELRSPSNETIGTLSTNGIDNGVGNFRAFSDGIDRVAGCVAVLRRRIPADPAGQVYIGAAFLFLGPRRNAVAITKLRTTVKRLVDDADTRERIVTAKDPAELSAFLESSFAGYGSDLVARDVMRKPYMYLTTDLPLRHVVRQMLKFNIEAVGILDEQRRIQGEITSDLLFHVGMPDFFAQLRSVAFLGDFDPFEKYFEREATLTVGSVMSTDFAAVEESTPIIEVIFHLAVQRKWKVYVTKNGELIGVIDRMQVLERVLNS